MSEPYRFEDFPEADKPVVRVRATPELLERAASWIENESQKADSDADYEVGIKLAAQLRQAIQVAQ